MQKLTHVPLAIAILLVSPTILFVSATHAQGTFPEPLRSASNSFVCTRETSLLWTVFNRTSTDDVDNSPRRRPQLIRFPPDPACRSAAVTCEQCLVRFPTSAAASVRNCSGTGLGDNDGQLAGVVRDLARCTVLLSIARYSTKNLGFGTVQGGAKNGTILSHCKYSENSMTELRGNW